MSKNRLEIITGGMFAGKSTKLIELIQKEVEQGNEVIAFKPLIDDRYSRDSIVSHDKKIAKTGDGIQIVLLPLKDFELNLEDNNKVSLIVFDEVQFFDTNTIAREIKKLQGDHSKHVHYNRRIVCGGLNMTAMGEPFGCMPFLLAMADQVTVLSAECSCGERTPATRTYRKIKMDEVNVIGGSELYEPKCLKCWVSLQSD